MRLPSLFVPLCAHVSVYSFDKHREVVFQDERVSNTLQGPRETRPREGNDLLWLTQEARRGADLSSCSHALVTKGRVLSLLLWPTINAHLCLKRYRNGRDKALPSKSSELGQVDSNHQGEGPEVPSVTFDLTRVSIPNRRHSRRSRWAERGGCTFPNTHILASDHDQYVSSN